MIGIDIAPSPIGIGLQKLKSPTGLPSPNYLVAPIIGSVAYQPS